MKYFKRWLPSYHLIHVILWQVVSTDLWRDLWIDIVLRQVFLINYLSAFKCSEGHPYKKESDASRISRNLPEDPNNGPVWFLKPGILKRWQTFERMRHGGFAGLIAIYGLWLSSVGTQKPERLVPALDEPRIHILWKIFKVDKQGSMHFVIVFLGLIFPGLT